MAGTFQTFRFSYNLTTQEFTIPTANVIRTRQEQSVIRQTPTGERYKQIFGSGKYRWQFSFVINTAREILTIFQSAYDNQSAYPVTMSEEQDDGSYVDYTVLINQPTATPDSIDLSAPIDRGLSVEVLEA